MSEKLTPQEKKKKNWYDYKIRSSFFRYQISNLRWRFGIPKSGFKKKHADIFDWPIEWRYSKDKEMKERVEYELRKLIEDYFLDVPTKQLHPLLFYNLKQQYEPFFSGEEFCRLTDFRGNRVAPDMKYSLILQAQIKKGFGVLKFPLYLQINPYANITDIREFIDRNKNLIEGYLERFRKESVLLRKIKSRTFKVAEVYDFVWKKRKLPHKIILRMVIDRFNKIDWDVTRISTIIQREKKSRLGH